MKLQIRQDFTIEHSDAVYVGSVRELTKKEQKQFKEEFKEQEQQEKQLNKLKRKKARVNADIEINKELNKYEELPALLDKLEALELEIEAKENELDTEELLQNMLRKRFEATVKFDNPEHLEAVRQLAEDFGYALILETIAKDAEKKKPKK